MLKVDFSEYNKKYEEVGKISEGNFAKVYKIRNI